MKIMNNNSKHVRKFVIFLAVIFCVGAFYMSFLMNNSNNKSKIANVNSIQSDVNESGMVSCEENSQQKSLVSKSDEIKSVTLDEAKKPLWIKVIISKQKTFIFDSNNHIVKSFVCSTGKEGDETPIGTFKIHERGKSFYSKKYKAGAYYWTQFKGDFLFHSIPFDENKNIDEVEVAKLGKPASHGCVRLSIEDAKWIYDNIQRNTKVVISEFDE